jgi:hypothetical protein
MIFGIRDFYRRRIPYRKCNFGAATILYKEGKYSDAFMPFVVFILIPELALLCPDF